MEGINNLRYADDTTLLADSEGKKVADVVMRKSGNRGLTVNIG